MKQFTKITTSSIALLFIGLWAAQPAHAADPPPAQLTREHVMIAELKVYDSTNTDYDFIELYNPNSEPVNVTGWLVQYRTASTTPDKAWVDKTSTGKDQDTRARLGCGTGCQLSIAGKGRLLVASPAAKLVTADVIPASNLGFASAGGQVRLVSVAPLTGAQTQEDLVGYGKISSTGLPTATAEKSPVPVHAAGGSLKRVMESQDQLLDSDDNASDFELSSTPTPGLADIYEPPTPPAAADATGGLSGNTASATVIIPTELAQVHLNEILPDPASPLTDDKDEYIELLNDGTAQVNLKGTVITVGTSRPQRYTFVSDTVLEPGAYYVLYARDSKLALTNSGTTVQLATATGVLIDSTSYDEAPTGQSWSLIEDVWQWSDVLTPMALNQALEPDSVPPKVTKTTKSPRPKATKAAAKPKKASTKKAKTAKTAKAKKTKSKQTTQAAIEPAAKHDASGWVAGGMAMITSGYLAYDYRGSLRRFVTKLTKRRSSES